MKAWHGAKASTRCMRQLGGVHDTLSFFSSYFFGFAGSTRALSSIGSNRMDQQRFNEFKIS